jgi:Cu/Ag efflux protein CusF
MKRALNVRVAFVFVMVCFLAGWIARVEAKPAAQAAKAAQVGSGEIRGVVTSSKGPEAGVCGDCRNHRPAHQLY